MAAYFLRSTHISRNKGAVATRAAAYRSGERIKDERTGQIHDFSDRRDVAYKEVVLPSDLAGQPDMAWAQDRAILWNAMEHAGTRRNARVAREWLVLVPPELTPDQRVRLVRTFATDLSNKYRCAVDCAIHQPRPGADPRNYHAHLLMTTREVSPDGIGARTTLELGGRERFQRGLGPSRDEYLAIRERWAQVTNEALREAGLNLRVDHRSFERQGVNREPTPSIPEKVFYAERKYGHSAAGDAIRARHRERVEARQKSSAELARVVEKQKKELKEHAREDFKQLDTLPKKIRWNALTKSERNQLRREKYEARRVFERQDPVGEARRRELGRQRYHESRARNPQLDTARRREWRNGNRDEVNRKQREYRKANADELNRKRREYWRDHTDEANRKQRDYRRAARVQDNPSSSPTSLAMESAKKWLEYRETHGPGPTAEESARN
ncbi:MAG TPA: MobA/MobL family protein, partial [Steroidobacteraceae bacterium]|nr:MobA/MobL family protein [Steroidobacteraceae bacterium]